MSAESPVIDPQAARPWVNPWMIALTVMTLTFMEAFDTAANDVAMGHIAGSLAASADEITWIFTSYLVSSAVVLVSTGWLTRHFGRKRLLLSCIVIFTAASALCGAATSLAFMVFVRAIQGLGGGVFLPTAQAMLLESFPAAKRGHAMTVYALGMMAPPLFGPPLGGWIADNYSWRWIFYINLPIGVFTLLMTQAFIYDSPTRTREKGRIDYIGFALLAIGLGALQITLSKGHWKDWFSSTLIRNGAIVAIVALAVFIIRQLRAETPIVDLRALKNRNFAIGANLFAATCGMVFYGTITLLPHFFHTVLGYTSTLIGQTLTMRGIGGLAAAIIVGPLIRKIDIRLIIIGGIGLLALSTHQLGSVDLEVDEGAFLWPCVINGFAIGVIIPSVTMAAVSALKPEQISNATGIFNLLRNLGGGVGIAVVNTILARRQQWRQMILTSRLTPYDRPFQRRFQLVQRLIETRRATGLGAGGQTFFRHSSGGAVSRRAYGVIYGAVLKQASLLASLDIFRLLTLLCLACAPLALFLKKAEKHGD